MDAPLWNSEFIFGLESQSSFLLWWLATTSVHPSQNLGLPCSGAFFIEKQLSGLSQWCENKTVKAFRGFFSYKSCSLTGLKVWKGLKLLPLLSNRAQAIFVDAWSWPHESEREWWHLWLKVSVTLSSDNFCQAALEVQHWNSIIKEKKIRKWILMWKISKHCKKPSKMHFCILWLNRAYRPWVYNLFFSQGMMLLWVLWGKAPAFASLGNIRVLLFCVTVTRGWEWSVSLQEAPSAPAGRAGITGREFCLLPQNFKQYPVK